MSSNDNAELWHSPSWYGAVWLTERVPSQASKPDTAFSVALEDEDRAVNRLQTWKAQKPFADEGLFSRRLASDSISERDLLSLLGESLASLQARVGDTPEWLTELRHAYETGFNGVEDIRRLLQMVSAGHPLEDCIPAIAPLLQRGLAFLENAIQRLREEYALLPFDPEQQSRIFLKNIVPQLLFQLSKQLVLEM